MADWNFGVPVHEAAVAVDQLFGVEGDEDAADGLAQAVVHGETLAWPIERGAEAAELGGDSAAGLSLPLPDAIDECLASEDLARGAFSGK